MSPEEERRNVFCLHEKITLLKTRTKSLLLMAKNPDRESVHFSVIALMNQCNSK
jgi:hypothetical protein